MVKRGTNMVKLQGKNIYLGTLEREHCKILWDEFEYDFENVTEQLNIGHSIEKAEEWFEQIKKEQGNSHIRLGIFLNNGKIIGDIALQDIDTKNRSCTIGMGIAKLEYRNKGYGKEAAKLLLEYGFNNYGLERIKASTLEINIPAQKSLEKLGFKLEGKERKAVYFGGKKYNKYIYGLLIEEYNKRK
jgi:RimJ/RimL family protein N-acetyltransferase